MVICDGLYTLKIKDPIRTPETPSNFHKRSNGINVKRNIVESGSGSSDRVGALYRDLERGGELSI